MNRDNTTENSPIYSDSGGQDVNCAWNVELTGGNSQQIGDPNPNILCADDYEGDREELRLFLNCYSLQRHNIFFEKRKRDEDEAEEVVQKKRTRGELKPLPPSTAPPVKTRPIMRPRTINRNVQPQVVVPTHSRLRTSANPIQPVVPIPLSSTVTPTLLEPAQILSQGDISRDAVTNDDIVMEDVPRGRDKSHKLSKSDEKKSKKKDKSDKKYKSEKKKEKKKEKDKEYDKTSKRDSKSINLKSGQGKAPAPDYLKQLDEIAPERKPLLRGFVEKYQKSEPFDFIKFMHNIQISGLTLMEFLSYCPSFRKRLITAFQVMPREMKVKYVSAEPALGLLMSDDDASVKEI